MRDGQPPRDDQRPIRGGEPPPLNGAAFAGMGLSAASTVGAGTVLGYLADGHWHTSPWFLLAGIAVGLACAVLSVIVLIRRYL